MFKVLPDYISGIIKTNLEYEKIQELRLRINSPIVINYGGKYMYLSKYGVSGLIGSAIVCDKRLLDGVVVRACDFSVYAVTGQLKQAFVTVEGGVRIGVSGEVVAENGVIKTIKNYSSVVIRVPHNIKGCSDKVFNLITKPYTMSTLIVSPPGGGKTTLLRDLSDKMCCTGVFVNVLIIDERSEIAACVNGIPSLKVGSFCDILTNCSKEFGFYNGIRSLKPDLIITDEIMGEEDLFAVRYAVSCGVKVFASVHAENMADLKRKSGFATAFNEATFDRFVFLSDRLGAGTLESVCDKEGNNLYHVG